MGKKSYHTGQRRVVLPNDSHDVFVPPHLENDPLNEPDREALAALAEETPLGAIGTPEDVAEAIWYLSSDAARFVTGQVLAPNGGLVI